MLTRRTAVRGILSAAAAFACHQGARSARAEADEPIVLRPGPGAPVNIATEFMGLGYEMSSVARLGLLSPNNREYVALVRGLGAKGIMRVGGIVADYTRFDAHGPVMAEPHNTVISEASLRQFSGFLERTGWRAIWSLNFAQGSLQDAVNEARAVEAALGTRLFAFELGNEVENYARGSHPFRPSTWDYGAYRREYSAWLAAIRKAVPRARFAAPDTASSVQWVEEMASDANGDVQLLTTHYYRTDQSHGSAEQLLIPDPKLKDTLSRLSIASGRGGIPWRMCEANSFSGGGLPGVSDSLIGALWTLDFMLLLAKFGCSGVNIETGVNQLGFLSCYSPIRNDNSGNASAGTTYYGMLAFAEARKGCTQMLAVDADLKGLNATAYSLGRSGTRNAMVFVNRERSRNAVVTIQDLGMRDVTVLRLTGSSKSQTTFGESSVDAEGHWSAMTMERARDGKISVPAMSAIVARAGENDG